MDTGYDFIQPEFLNILFFKQLNLVIFPYVDKKILYNGLDVYFVGFSITPIESNLIYNAAEVLDQMRHNDPYDSQPDIFFILDLQSKNSELSTFFKKKDFRCVINLVKSVDINDIDLTSTNFVFYDKKIKKFYNYNNGNDSLDFERSLISTSRSINDLRAKLELIKSKATVIMNRYIGKDSIELSEILKDFDKSYWSKILEFTSNYYKLQINVSDTDFRANSMSNKEQFDLSLKIVSNQKYSEEFSNIKDINVDIGREFILCLLNYKENKVNKSNLDFVQLFSPEKLYSYLRDHQWKDGISQGFLLDWASMKNTSFKITDSDVNDFENLLNKLNVDKIVIKQTISIFKPRTQQKKKERSVDASNYFPPISNFEDYKKKTFLLIEEIKKRLTM